MTKELLINAALAGFWTALAIVTASNQPLDKAALFAAAAAGLRFAIGYVAAALKRPVPVDQ